MRKISMKKKSRTSNSESSEHKDEDKSGDENVHSSQEDDQAESSNEAEEEPVKKSGKKSKKNKKSKVTTEENGTEKKSKKSKEPVSEEEDEDQDEDEDDEQYEVEAVLDEKMVKGVRHYLIKWKGYNDDGNTWEPESTLSCPDLIEEYRKSKPDTPSKKRSKPSKDNKTNKKQKKDSKNEKKDDDDGDSETEYEVDKILDVYYRKNGKREFLVHWKGYSARDNSWEPEDNMDCKELIERFMYKVEKAKAVDARELRVRRAQTDRFTLNMVGSGRKLSKRNMDKQRVHYYDAE